MKIAIFHELPQGGARRAMNEYAKQLKKNHVVDLFIVDDEVVSDHKLYSNAQVYKLRPKPWVGNNWKVRIYKDTIELIKLFFLNRKIAQEIDMKKYDVVLVSASRYIEAPFIMRFLKTPFAFFIHDPYYRIIYDPMLKISKDLDLIRYNYERLNRFIRKLLDRKNISKASLCLVPSKFIARLFSKTYKKDCKIVYYGVDIDLFKPSRIKKDYDIFYVGSTNPIDGYSFAEQVAKQMKFKPNMKSLLVDKEWISDDRKLVNLYQRSRVMLATAYNEGLGAVPLEAMACGVPVVATDEAGHKETVIDGVNGYLLLRDSRLFAEKIEWLLSQPEECRKMGNIARDIMVKDWSWAARSSELLGILKDISNRAK